jgi:hypothetical protein
LIVSSTEHILKFRRLLHVSIIISLYFICKLCLHASVIHLQCLSKLAIKKSVT